MPLMLAMKYFGRARAAVYGGAKTYVDCVPELRDITILLWRSMATLLGEVLVSVVLRVLFGLVMVGLLLVKP